MPPVDRQRVAVCTALSVVAAIFFVACDGDNEAAVGSASTTSAVGSPSATETSARDGPSPTPDLCDPANLPETPPDLVDSDQYIVAIGPERWLTEVPYAGGPAKYRRIGSSSAADLAAVIDDFNAQLSGLVVLDRTMGVTVERGETILRVYQTGEERAREIQFGELPGGFDLGAALAVTAEPEACGVR